MNTKKNPEKSVFGFASMAIVVALVFCAIVASGQNIPNGNLSAAESKSDMLYMLRTHLKITWFSK